ncbi:MAG: FixH family protein [Bacteroidia bacterium]|jgi:hypothetical protein|nr:FixH family protein [Bacteroidia bacterium]
MKNISWSKIVVGILVTFVVFILTLVIWMALSPQSLYEEDYYERGENYAVQMKGELLGKNVTLDLDKESRELKVSFDKLGYVKSVRMICLSNQSQDKEIKMSNKILKPEVYLNLKGLQSGLWIIEIYGNSGNDSFY